MQRINLHRTNYVIKMKEKQIEKIRQQPSDAFSLPDYEDMSGVSGYVFKICTEKQNVRKVPVRISDLNLLRTGLVATSLLYENGKLLVGDELGFVTSYDLTEILKEVTLKPTEKKYSTKNDQKVLEGFLQQKLQVPVQYLTRMYTHTKPEVLYSFRAHTKAITNLELLTGQKDILTYGLDRRLMVFDIETASLRGMVQRVQLQKPTEFIERYFTQDIKNFYTKQPAKTRTVEPKYSLPPTRIEYPPACQFSWQFRPKTQILDATSGVNQNQLLQTLKQRQALPTYETCDAEALLKTTGLTPDRLMKHRNSWTVRAIVGKATGWKLDASNTNISNTELLRSFSCRVEGDDKKIKDLSDDEI